MSIQAAIDDADVNDKIVVRPDTYYEGINFDGKAIHLYSSDGPEVTIIDGEGYYHVVQCVSGEGPNTIIEGFTITGGNANGSYPNDCGGGMYNYYSSPMVKNCNFKDNSATEDGGGMFNDNSSPTLTNCIFFNNYAADVGGAMVMTNSNTKVTNCTFSGNSAVYAGAMRIYQSIPILTNCILWGNTASISGPEIYAPGETFIINYSDIEGGWSGEGNIDINPLLRNVAKGDLSLSPWSPCIDAGSNDVVAPDSTDITGLSRLVDGDCNTTVTVDMGAHEFRHAYGGDFDSSCLVNMADYSFLAWAWLAGPQSENWNPVCDISTPADGHINAGDVKVLTGNWLRSIETPVTCDANRLKDEFGLDAPCAAAVLRAAPCAYSPNDVAQILYDLGYSAAGAYLALTQVCGMTDGFSIEQILYDAGYPPDEYLESTALSFVKKFAPVLYFHRDPKGLPMSAQVYFETMMSPRPDAPSVGQITWSTPWNGPCGMPGVIYCNGRDEDNTCGMQNFNDFSTLVNGEIPTYYKVVSDIDSVEPTGDKGRLRIAYWWFYGFQKYCNPLVLTDPGEHHGDWENIIVTTDPDRTRADAVTYSFHGLSYTRLSGGFETEPNDDTQGRPVVYVGKVGHGNYHSMACLWEGTPYYCCEYVDCRTPDENTKWRIAYKNLVNLSGNSEPWILADRIGSLYEYYGKKYEISQWRWGPHISYCDDGLFTCNNWKHVNACGNHPTNSGLDWTLKSCDGVGCGASKCEGLIDRDYPQPAYYNEGWPWGGAASSAAVSATPAKPATPKTYGSVASCGRCGTSRFGALVRLGNYWLAGAKPGL
ncbi:MAG: right-handed parallel beta-helix repeat-containing protein [Planctomycetota bacterium]